MQEWFLKPNHLSTNAVNKIVKRYLACAGFDPDRFGAHSLRAGMITSAVRKKVSVFRLKTHTRHKSMESLAGYVRESEVFEEHPGKDLL